MRFAFIGTGPISLLNAFLTAKEYPESEIVLFDGRSLLGGAWYSDFSPKGYEIECGCHIWSFHKDVYHYIENVLDIPLEIKKPTPVFIGSRMKLPYSLKSTIDSFSYLARVPFTSRNLQDFKNNPKLSLKVLGKQNKYPKTGSPELISALKAKLDNCPNVSYRLDKKIERIKIDRTVHLNSLNENQLFDKVFLTSVSDLKSVEFADKVINITQKRLDYVHFLLSTSKPLKKKLFYWRVMNDPIIHRIADISYQTNNEEQLSLVGIKQAAFESRSEEDLFVHCKRMYEKYGLIDSSHQLKKIKTHVFPTFYIEENIREQINQINPAKIELIHTTDLMYGIYFLLKKKELI